MKIPKIMANFTIVIAALLFKLAICQSSGDST